MSRSISGHVITLLDPVHWSSKRQTITARSSCKAEIYATDECEKYILHIRNIIQDLNLEKELLHEKTTKYNDNMACVLWSKISTTNGLRYLQIHKKAIHESQKMISLEHICGDINIADLFSKEDTDPNHFSRLVKDTIVVNPFQKTTPTPIEYTERQPKNTLLRSRNECITSAEENSLTC